ncbi:MAG: hypothetical protein IPK37_19055 [Austwickia sp.]|nr:MAG: hypothetical protein IPK37_19055 [Austwickia sp.]
MLVDCEGCPVRGRACASCAVGVLLTIGPPRPGEVCLDGAEMQAVEAFVRAGLVDAEVAEGFVAMLDEAAMVG